MSIHTPKAIYLCLFLLFFTTLSFSQQHTLKFRASHGNAINTLSIDSKGRYVASGSWDNVIKLWEVDNGRLVQDFLGHTHYISSVEFSPNGTHLASGSGDRTIRIWNIRDGKLVKVLRGHKDGIKDLVYSKDGNYILSGGKDESVRLWSVDDGKCLQVLKGHKRDILSVDISPDGHYAVSGSKDYTIRLWNLHTERCVRVMEIDSSYIHAVRFSVDGKTLISGSSDGKIRYWDVRTGEMTDVISAHNSIVQSIAIDPLGEFSASASWDHTIKLWKTTNKRDALILDGHKDKVYDIAFSAENNLLVSAGKDRKIAIWNTKSGRLVRTLQGRVDFMNAADFSWDNRYIGTAGIDGNVYLWNSEGNIQRILQGHIGSVNDVTFDPSGRYLISASNDKTVWVWEAHTGKKEAIFKEDYFPINAVAVSGDGKYIASGGDDHTVKLWDLYKGKYRKPLIGHFDDIRSVAFSPDGQYVLSGSEDRTIKLWDSFTGKTLRTFIGHTNHILTVAFSPNENFIVSGSRDKTIKLWDITSGRCIRTLRGHRGHVTTLSVSPDERLIVSGSSDHTIKLWESHTGRCLRTLRGHSNRINSLSFSKDGRLLISSGADGKISIWDVAGVKEIASLVSFDHGSGYIVTTPDGKFDGNLAGLKELYYVKGNRTFDIAENKSPKREEGLFESVLALVSSHSESQLTLNQLEQNEGVKPSIEGGEPKFDIIETEFITLANSLERGLKFRIKNTGTAHAREMKVVVQTPRNVLPIHDREFIIGTLEREGKSEWIDFRFFANVQYTSSRIPLEILVYDHGDVLFSQTVVYEREKLPTERRDYALIFAVNDYEDPEWSHIPNAIKGGRELKNELSNNFGFEVELFENPSIDSIFSVLDQYFTKDYNPNDQLLVFFSGHGDVDKNPLNDSRIGYLVASDSYGTNRRSYLPHSTLSAKLNGSNCQHVFVAIDACYSSTFGNEIENGIEKGRTDKHPQMKEFIQQELKYKSRLYLTSGKDKTLVGRPGQNSPFTKQLLTALRGSARTDGVITFSEILSEFAPNTTSQPSPKAGEFGDHEAGGNFLFILDK